MSDDAFEGSRQHVGTRRICANVRSFSWTNLSRTAVHVGRNRGHRSSLRPTGLTPTNDLETISRPMNHAAQTN